MQRDSRMTFELLESIARDGERSQRALAYERDLAMREPILIFVMHDPFVMGRVDEVIALDDGRAVAKRKQIEVSTK